MRNFTENQIELLLIRHGKTRANQEKRYLGKTEEDLSQQGKTELGQRVYPPVKSLFGSPMQRCIQTAELIYPNLSYQNIPEWKEMDFGRFEGKNYEDLKGDADYQRWIDSNGTLPFPEGESREDFILRCGRGFRRFLEIMTGREIKRRFPQTEEHSPAAEEHSPVAEKHSPAAAIVHGGTIMALLSHYGLKGDYFDYQCGNGEGYQCLVKFCVAEDGKILQDSIRIEEITPLTG